MLTGRLAGLKCVDRSVVFALSEGSGVPQETGD